jgi:formyltetrahydrofolate deformylase
MTTTDANFTSRTRQRWVLKIQCQDAKGLIARFAGLIQYVNGNIVDLYQHTAEDINMFFFLAYFDIDSSESIMDILKDKLDAVHQTHPIEWELHCLQQVPRLAILVSKTDHCLYELLLKKQDGQLDCSFPLIISNHMDLEPIAQHFSIPFFHLDVKNQSKAQAEAELETLLKKFSIEGVIMARYMQILSPDFCRRWPNRIINIHHGFLPAFQGAKPYHQAWNKGVKLIGATAHFATADLDQGPIIYQETLRVADTCHIQDFVKSGKDIERKVLYHAVRSYLQHRIFVHDSRTFVLE